MGYHLSPFQALFALTIFVFMMVLKVLCKKGKFKPLNLVPGPRKLPIIGNMHQMVGSLPHHKLRDLPKKYEPLMHLQLGEVTTIVVSSPENAKEFLKTYDFAFAGRPTNLAIRIITYGLSDVAFAPHGEQWRQFRKVGVLELLSAKRVQSFQTMREEEALNLVSSISCPLHVASLQRRPLVRNAKTKKHSCMLWMKLSKSLEASNLGDMFPSAKWLHLITGTEYKLRKLHRKVDMIFENIINEHRARKLTRKVDDDDGECEPTDFVDVLLNLQVQGGLGIPVTTTDIKAMIQDMFSAGSEISAVVVEWAMSELLKNPRVMKKAQAEVRQVFDAKRKIADDGTGRRSELDNLHLVIKETLRLHPPTPLVTRESTVQFKVQGYDIPVKSKILINLWAIGRDPKHWDHPEKFYPERFVDNPTKYEGNHFQLTPFGAGKRMCPGILFGVSSIQILLASLLYHFDWELPDGIKNEELDMTDDFGKPVGRKIAVCCPYSPPPNSVPLATPHDRATFFFFVFLIWCVRRFAVLI